VLVLSDSCHSGTVTRNTFDRQGAGVPASDVADPLDRQPRAIPSDIEVRTLRKNRSSYKSIFDALPKKAPPISATVRLISACQDNQGAYDGMKNGLFTARLLSVWHEGQFKGTYKAFYRSILMDMPDTESPNHYVIGTPSPAYDAQKPFQI